MRSSICIGKSWTSQDLNLFLADRFTSEMCSEFDDYKQRIAAPKAEDETMEVAEKSKKAGFHI